MDVAAAVEPVANAAPPRPLASMGTVAAACAVLAIASLVLPATLAFDPWAWLVWGREVADLDLDTTGGPSWKPLPVLVTTLLSLAGGAASTLWLVVARAASLLALVGAYRVAARLATRWAGVVAAGLLLLTPDLGARFSRLTAEGHVASIGATLTLFAVERHIAGARRQALLLATGLALMRPEAWPLLVAYAAWLCSRDREARGLVASLLLCVPLLWFGGDWWGSGDPLHGADAAQVASGGAVDRLTMAIDQALDVVALPVWIAAAGCLLLARGRVRRVSAVLAAAAGLWVLAVVAMATFGGYAALSRFYLPAGAVLCVLAAVGVSRAMALAASQRSKLVVATAIVVASVPGLAPRVLALDELAEEARTRHDLDRALDTAIADAGGRDALVGCGVVAIDNADLAGPLLPALAWKLQIPLDAVERELDGSAGVLFARADRPGEATLDQTAVVLGRSDEWVVYAVGCASP